MDVLWLILTLGMILVPSQHLDIDAICWALPKKGLCRSMFDCNRCVLHEGEWPLSCVCSLVTARDLPVCPLGTILLIRLLSTNQKSSLSHPPYRAKRPLERVWHGSWTPYTHTEKQQLLSMVLSPNSTHTFPSENISKPQDCQRKVFTIDYFLFVSLLMTYDLRETSHIKTFSKEKEIVFSFLGK